MVTRSAEPGKDMAHAPTLGHSNQKRGDHFGLRKDELVMEEESRRVEGKSKSEEIYGLPELVPLKRSTK